MCDLKVALPYPITCTPFKLKAEMAVNTWFGLVTLGSIWFGFCFLLSLDLVLTGYDD